MLRQSSDISQFYLTTPCDCPYISGQKERRIFTRLDGKHAKKQHDILSQHGFRRSQNVAYKPACDQCCACESTRVIVADFCMSKSMRRIWQKNTDLIAKVSSAQASISQYELFQAYLKARHHDGNMSHMQLLDYVMMVEATGVDTQVIEYRKRIGNNGRRGVLLAVSIADILSDGLSMVYSFYDPSEFARSLGTWMILDHIDRAKHLGLPYLYLGFWVKTSPKMAYKARFKPQERFSSDGWLRVE